MSFIGAVTLLSSRLSFYHLAQGLLIYSEMRQVCLGTGQLVMETGLHKVAFT